MACFLHHNGKPFEHLFHFHDGKTTGMKSYEGPIGKATKGDNLHKEKVAKFKPVPPVSKRQYFRGRCC